MSFFADLAAFVRLRRGGTNPGHGAKEQLINMHDTQQELPAEQEREILAALRDALNDLFGIY